MVVRQMGIGLAVAVGLLAVVCFSSVRAADPPKEKAADEKQAKDDDKSKDEAADRYEVPDGDVKTLLEFINKIRTFRPTTAQEAREHRVKSLAAMKAAANVIKETATDEDKALDGYSEAMDLLLYLEVQSARTASAEDQQKLANEIKAALQSSKDPSMYLINAARTMPRTFEYGGDPDRAVDLYRELGDVLAKNPDPKIARQGASMIGAARRLTLVGNPMELSGTLVDGGTLDWDSYRGKVVLVDFWATWCGPCLRELPNVKKNYEVYHDKGFDVVAVSLDDDRAKLDAFLEKDPKPWTNLHDGGWSENDVATYYGIVGIPTVILVDKEGKVVSTRARGPELGRLLEELLGPVEAKDTDDADDKTEAKAAN